MPIYVYRCEGGHEVEVVHGMMEQPVMACGECGRGMWKKPVWQGRWYRDPVGVLYEHMDNKFREAKAKHKRRQSGKNVRS